LQEGRDDKDKDKDKDKEKEKERGRPAWRSEEDRGARLERSAPRSQVTPTRSGKFLSLLNTCKISLFLYS